MSIFLLFTTIASSMSTPSSSNFSQYNLGSLRFNDESREIRVGDYHCRIEISETRVESVTNSSDGTEAQWRCWGSSRHRHSACRHPPFLLSLHWTCHMCLSNVTWSQHFRERRLQWLRHLSAQECSMSWNFHRITILDGGFSGSRSHRIKTRLLDPFFGRIMMSTTSTKEAPSSIGILSTLTENGGKGSASSLQISEGVDIM